MVATTSWVLHCGVLSAHSSSGSRSGCARNENISHIFIFVFRHHAPARPLANIEVVVDNLSHLLNPVPYPCMMSCVPVRDVDLPGIKWQPELSVASFEVRRGVPVAIWVLGYY